MYKRSVWGASRRESGAVWSGVVVRMGTERSNVIHVDFATRRRRYGPAITAPITGLLPEPVSAVGGADDFWVFWRSPRRNRRAEYLGGRWNRGWMLFVWTDGDLVGAPWRNLIEARGYLAQRLERDALRALLVRSTEVVGLIVNGDIDPEMRTIRAAPEQMVPRGESLRLLRGWDS